MAVSDIQATVLRITGVTPTANSVEDAQRFIVSSVPKDLLMFAQKVSSASTDGSAISFSVNDSITDVQRNGYSCVEIPMSDAVWALDSSSLRFATAKRPVFYHKQGAVHFAPVTDGSNAGYVFYVDFSLIDDDCDLRNAVIYHAASHEFTKLGTDLVPTWTSPVLPVTPSSPNFGSDLTISVSSPSTPAGPVITSPGVATINKADISGDVPAYTKPTYVQPVQSFDISQFETFLETEEDSELAQIQLGRINHELGEYQANIGIQSGKYQADIQNELNEFNKENAKYQANIQAEISKHQTDAAEAQKEGDLTLQASIQDYTLRLQNFSADVGKYQADVNKEIQDFSNTLTKETQEYQSKLSKYGSELQSYQAVVSEQTQEKAMLQQNITYYSQQSEKYSKLALSEVQQYIQFNSKMINKTMAAQAAQQQRG